MSEIPEIGKISAAIFNELIYPRLGTKDDKILVGPQNGAPCLLPLLSNNNSYD